MILVFVKLTTNKQNYISKDDLALIFKSYQIYELLYVSIAAWIERDPGSLEPRNNTKSLAPGKSFPV